MLKMYRWKQTQRGVLFFPTFFFEKMVIDVWILGCYCINYFCLNLVIYVVTKPLISTWQFHLIMWPSAEDFAKMSSLSSFYFLTVRL
jgi:hypothetical protein